MKTTIKTLFSLLLTLFMVSCSDDDNASNASIEGIWELRSLSVESAFDFNDDGTSSTDLIDEVPCYDDDYLEFNADGSVQIVNAFTQISIDVISDTEYEYVYQCLTGLNIGSIWTQDGNSVTVENGSNDLVGTIDGNELTV